MHQSSYNIITRFRELVEKNFSQKKIKVLDMGSDGANSTYKDIFSDSEKYDYTGLDVNARSNADYVPSDTHCWPELQDESFDVIVSGQAFEHIEYPWLIIKEMHRVLKTNGLICIVAPSRGPEHKHPVDCWRYYPDGFRALAKWVNLEVIEAKTSWEKSGFVDDSDQWGDTFCILYKNATNESANRPGDHQKTIPQTVSKNNPLRSGKKTSYYSFERQDAIDAILKSGIQPKRILEVGCAGGATGKKLKEVFKVDYYVGVEMSHEAAQIAKGYLDKVIIADIEKDGLTGFGLKLRDFDLLLALDVLEHLYNPWDTLALLSDYVKSGGYVVASIPNAQNITVLKDLIKGRWKYEDAGILDATHLRFFTHNSIEELFFGVGLTIMRTDSVLNPKIDVSTLKETGNNFKDDKLSLTDLSKEEIIKLLTYQYLVIARKDSSEMPLQSDSSEIKDRLPIKGLTSIVILTCNALKYTQECVASIEKYTPEPHEIIFVDNNSIDGTVKWLNKLAKENARYKLIQNSENMGFAKGCNQGIEVASGEYILLLNNDVVVTEEWLSGMLECLNSSPDIGIVGPMTNNISGLQQIVDTDYSINRLTKYASLFRERNRHRHIPLRRIVGFCMLFRHELIEKVGLLDESFGTGNFEDDDFCFRAALEGYRNMIAGDVFIHHYGSRSFIGNNISYNSLMTNNKKILDEKWQHISASSPLGKKVAVFGYSERAEAYYQQQNTDLAVTTLIEGIKYMPDNKTIYFRLTEMLIDTERFGEAIEVLNTMPEDAKTSAKWHALAGYCKDGMGSHEEAGKHADNALTLDPNSSLSLNLKGKLIDAEGDPKVAEDYFRKAIASDPGYGRSYTNLGLIKWASEDKSEAMEYLEKGFVLSPTTPDCILLYHSAIKATGQLERAENLFREIRRFYFSDKKMHFLFIDLLIGQEKYRTAMEEIEKAIISYGIDEGILSAAKEMRNRVGTLKIGIPRKAKTLSVCMIAKNEEENLPRCLRNLKPIADEIILVDTGSTDRTKEIAHAFGAQVFDFPWNDDFSAARNFSLSKANGQWVLVHDADEIISPKDYEKLRAIIRKKVPKPVAYTLITRNYTRNFLLEGWTANTGEYPEEEAGVGWVASPKVRLLINDERFRFVNPIHELLEPSLVKARIQVMSCGIPVHHYGPLNEKKYVSKGEFYYDLGKKKLDGTEKDIKAIRELATQASGIGKYGEAIHLWEEYIRLEPTTQAYYSMAYCHMELEEFENALAAARKALELDGNSPEAVLRYANVSLYAGNAEDTISSLEGLLEKAPDHPSALVPLIAAYAITDMGEKGISLVDKMKQQHYDCRIALHKISKKLVAAGRDIHAIRVLENIDRSGYTNAQCKELLDECYKRQTGDNPTQTNG